MIEERCPAHIGLEKEIESIKEKQNALRKPGGTIESLWADLKTKVSWQLFIWIVAAVFCFIAIMQTLIYRSLDDTSRKIEKLNDLVIYEMRRE